MSEENKPVEATETVSPEVVEDETHQAIDALLEDAPLDFKDNPFWIMQRLVWQVLKVAIVVGGIALILWLVWGSVDEADISSGSELVIDKTSTPARPKPVRSVVEKIVEPVVPAVIGIRPAVSTTLVPNQPKIQPAPTTVRVPISPSSLVPENDPLVTATVVWLKEAQIVGQQSLAVVRAQSPNLRVQELERLLQRAESLFAQSPTLQQQLINQRTQWLELGQQFNQRTVDSEVALQAAIAGLQASEVSRLVAQKITSQQQAAYYLQRAKLYDTLFKNVSTFDAGLRAKTIPLLAPPTSIGPR